LLANPGCIHKRLATQILSPKSQNVSGQQEQTVEGCQGTGRQTGAAAACQLPGHQFAGFPARNNATEHSANLQKLSTLSLFKCIFRFGQKVLSSIVRLTERVT